MYEREKTCCFTGHRISKLPWYGNEDDPRCIEMIEKLESMLQRIYNGGYRHFVSGMALGCDTYFAEAVIRLRERYGDVTLEAAIPCRSQAERWSYSQRQRYEALLRQCDTVTVLQEQYTPDCMMKRNMYMVDKSNVLLACFNGRSGGTLNTIRYAKEKGLICPIIRIE